ncbi:MAG: hypothetical protein JW741_16815, partial [Sedimentisphaerales bacterium]|nr:hypothetical protein [Sedimentisphaerales bacterium]
MTLCIVAGLTSVGVSSGARDQVTTATSGNSAISVSLDPADMTFSVIDNRTGHRWQQQVRSGGKVTNIRPEQGLNATWHDASLGFDVRMTVEVDASRPEFAVTLAAQGELRRPLRYPHPFVTEPGTYLVVPMNEGISYPVDDLTVDTTRLIAYGGHGICMHFWGATDGQQGYMAILETPDDAA